MKLTSTVLLITTILVVTTMSGCMETTSTTEYGEQTYNILTGETILDADYYEHGMHITGAEVYVNGTMIRCNCKVDGYFFGDRTTGTVTMNDGERLYWDILLLDDGSHITGTIGDDESANDYYNLTSDIDYHEDGMHISGVGILYGDASSEWCAECDVEGTFDGGDVVGIMSWCGEDEPYYNIQYDIDTYEEGLHMTGTMSLKGPIDDPTSSSSILNVDGYVDGMHIIGTTAQHGNAPAYHNWRMSGYVYGVYVTGALVGNEDTAEWVYN